MFCNESADGITSQSCGSAGCNADTASCNACVPDSVTCSADKTMLERCGLDGTYGAGEACGAGCVVGAAGPDHCGHITPKWLPDACDELATTAMATLSGTLDTSVDTNCTGGAVEVDGTNFCIIRAGKISVGDLKVTGNRVIAFVADDELLVTGTLDVSADGSTSGPGANGTFIGAGVTSLNSSYRGAGGAGFAQAGGAGGGNETGTEAGQLGGPITNRLQQTRFMAGARGGNSICGNGQIFCLNQINFSGGGGGGGANLMACRGPLTVSGTIDAGGGGGQGGGDHQNLSTTISQGGGAGGGTGGYVVLQGTQVVVTGKLYANGGGGGGACGIDNCRGQDAADGQRSRSGALGGDPPGNTCGGGIGGSATSAPGVGEQTFASAAAGGGGGGGSVGQFQIYTPEGVTPMIAPAEASPDPAPSLTIPVE
ncbi:MAG TPA: hypothetical protein VIU61_22210 [Kofleriaceae bacterium]